MTTITDADRKAAARCAGIIGAWSGTIIRDMMNGTCEAIRHEYEPQVALIEAFARHREAALAEVEKHLVSVAYDPAPYTAMKAAIRALKGQAQ